MPAVHGVHAAAPPVEKVPSAHCELVTDPVVQYEPAGHVEHSASAVRLVEVV